MGLVPVVPALIRKERGQRMAETIENPRFARLYSFKFSWEQWEQREQAVFVPESGAYLINSGHAAHD